MNANHQYQGDRMDSSRLPEEGGRSAVEIKVLDPVNGTRVGRIYAFQGYRSTTHARKSPLAQGSSIWV